MSRQSRQYRVSKKPGRAASRGGRYACEALEQRTLLSVVIIPNFVNVPGQPNAETYLQDKGGRLNDPGIVLIFWGSYWGGTNTSQAQTIKNAVSNICNSAYFQETAQYGTGGAAFLSSATAYISTNPAAGFSQGNVDSTVDQAIASGQIGAYTFNRSIYEVITPPGINSGIANASGFNRETASGHVDTWCSTGGTGTTTIAVDGFSLNICHETAEGMTDPGGQGIEFTPPPSWANGGSGNQIGDYEGNAYSFREPDGALVQPLWSSSYNAWVATDGNSQNIYLNANWSGNSFFGNYSLTVNGDQLGYNYNDTISLSTVNNNQVQVTLNGETTTFDPNRITGVTVNTYGGTNTENVLQTPSGIVTSIIGGGVDVTNIGAFSSVQSILGNVFVENTALNIDDSADGVEQDVFLSNGLLLGLSPGPISWAENDLRGLTISEGAGGNHITVNGTGTAPGAGTDTINAGSSSDVVNIYAIQIPLTVNGLGGPDTVNVAPVGQNLDAIQALLTLNGNGAIVNLDDQLDPNFILTEYAFSSNGFSRFAESMVGGQLVTRSESIATNSLGNVVLNAASVLNEVDVEGDASPVTINCGPATVSVIVSQNAENLNNVPNAVTVNGNGIVQLSIEDQNNASVIPVQNTFTSTSLTSIGYNYIFVNGFIPVLLPYGTVINFSNLGGMTFDAGTVPNIDGIGGTEAAITTTVNAGSGQSTVTVTATTGPLIINGQGGADTVAIGNAGNTQAVMGDVTVGNVGGLTTLTVDDSADATGRQFAIDGTSISGLEQGTIHYLETGGSEVINLSVKTGMGADIVNIAGANTIAGLVLSTGPGDDTVNVGAGPNQVVGLITAAIGFDGGSGTNSLNFDDQSAAQSSTWTVVSIRVTDLIPGIGVMTISNLSNFGSITINAGAFGSSFVVSSTPTAAAHVTFNEGAGNDTNTVGPAHLINHVAALVTINGNGGTNTLLVDDSNSAAPAIVHMTPTQIGATPGDTLLPIGGGVVYSGISTATINTPGASAGDAITVIPSATTAFAVNGGLPTTSPGDTLTIATIGVTTPVLTPNGTGAGQYTFGNRQPVIFTGIEQSATDNFSNYWAGLAGGSWSNPGNWAGGHVPTAGEIAEINIANGAIVMLTANQVVGGIQISSGMLDMGVSSLAINYGVGNLSPVFSVLEYLASGALYSSVAQANPRDAVGYADGGVDNGTAAQPGQVLLKYTQNGDANLDGLVNFGDLVAVVQNFNKGGTDWAHGNFGYGASTSFGDLIAVVQNFNKTLSPAASSAIASGGNTLLLGRSASIQQKKTAAVGASVVVSSRDDSPALAPMNDSESDLLESDAGSATILTE